MRALGRLLVSLVLATAGTALAGPRVVFAASCGSSSHCYAGVGSTSTKVSGIDGHIWGTNITLSDPQASFQAHFINICPSDDCSTGWAQIGPFEGTIGVYPPCNPPTCVSSTSIQMYGENMDGCGNYAITNFGAPPTSNEPYYLSYSGSSQVVDCRTQYKYYFRYGSINNPPAGTAWLFGSSGYPIAETEETLGVQISTDYFGLDGTHSVDDAYGLHVLKSSWVIWNSSNVPGTGSAEDLPPTIVVDKSFSAFHTHS